MFERKEFSQSVFDRFISLRNQIFYSIIEPIRLTLTRYHHERMYRTIGDEPLVSVYTTTFNRADILASRAIPSVLSQTYSNFEYIVVGDCCTDQTAEAVAKFDDPRIRFVNLQTNRKQYPADRSDRHFLNHWLVGYVQATNTALQLSTGKWIARIDDHAVWTPTHIADLLDAAMEGGYEFVTSSVVEERYGELTTSRGNYAFSEWTKLPTSRRRGIGNPRLGGHSTFFYRSYLKLFKYNVRAWRKKWNRTGETDVFIRMLNAGVRLGFLDKATVEHRPRPGEDTLFFDAYMEKIKKTPM